MNVFPLTALQKAYVSGRTVNGDGTRMREKESYELRCTGFDPERFEAAVQKLYAAHPMLRAVCSSAYTWEQRERTASAVTLIRAADAAELRGLADEQRNAFFAEAPCQPETLPVTFTVIADPERNAVIFTHTDGLYFDGESQGILLRDLEAAYSGEALPEDAGFAVYRDAWEPFAAENTAEADAFWQTHAATLPDAPVLPHESAPAGTYYTAERLLPAALPARLSEIAKSVCLTPFSLLLAIYCKTLERYAESKDFALNLPVSHRPFWEAESQNLIGLFADFTVIGHFHEHGQTVRSLAEQLLRELNIRMEQAPYSGVEILRHASRLQGTNVQVPYTFTSLTDTVQDGNTVFVKKGFRALTGGMHLETILQPMADGVLLTMTGDACCVSRQAAEGIADMFAQTCMQLMQDASVLECSVLPLPEQDAALLRQANDTPVHDVPQTLSGLLHSSLTQRSDAAAAFVNGKTYSYADLMQGAAGIQQAIRCAAPDGGRVGLLLQKGIRPLIAELTCACGGYVFFPIETEQPPEAIAYCIRCAEIRVLVTEQAFADILPQLPADKIVLAEDAAQINGAELIFRELKPDDEAFLIHTSGSTGRPKSIVLRQEGLINCLLHTAELFGISDADTCIAVTNYCHDMSLFDMIFMPAYHGRVVIPDTVSEKDPHRWIEMMLEHGVTVWNSVPAFMEMLLASEDKRLAEAAGHLRCIMLGGDWIRPAMLRQIREMNPAVRMFSVGGPSETTVWNIYHEVTAADLEGSFIPYGKPFPNTAYYILDSDFEPCPVGVRGGMFVAGKGVAKEYAGLPEETARRFLSVNGIRMYRTGDMGMYLPDGSIRILGREDFQVKINGKRIELAGIESAVKQVPGVQLCVVVQAAESKVLAAYFTADRCIGAQELQAVLRASLPPYMIPAHLIQLEEMPLTRNAKPDRKKLAAMPVQHTEKAAEIQFESEIKRKLYEMCCSILEDPALSPDDNFYYMGGDSISAMKLTAAIRKEFGVTPEVYDILNHPTLDEWTDMIAEAKKQLSDDSGETEMQLLDICRMLFPGTELSMADSLFSVGGSERSARMLAASIRSGFGAEIDLYEILSRPFFKDWAAMIKERTNV